MSVAVSKPLSVGLVLLCALIGALAFATAPALAAAGHVFGSSFGETCVVVPGEPCEGKFDDPTGVAVNNETGDVYVVDKGNSRVEEFNPAGTKLEAEFNGNGTAGKLSEPEAIAIDNSGETTSEDPSVGDVYVTDNGVVDKFEADGTYLSQIAAGEGGASFQPLEGVAVDPKGLVWVYQKNVEIDGEQHTYIDAFSDAQPNAFLSSRESQASPPTDPGLAVNSEDDLYVAHAEEEVKIAKLKSNGEVLETELGGEEGKTGVAVEASSNDVYIDSAYPFSSKIPEIQEFTPGGTEETFGQEQLGDHGATALAVSYANVSSGDVYVVDSAAGKVDIFTPPKVTVHAHSLSFGGKGTGSGELTEPSGVAVNDETEDVYVADKGDKRVEEFSKDGLFVTAFAPPGGFEDPEAIAVDNSGGLSAGDVYVGAVKREHGEERRVVDKFSAMGGYEGQLNGTCPAEGETQLDGTCEPSGELNPFGNLIAGISVDPQGNVWVTLNYSFQAFNEFSDTGAFVKTLQDEPSPQSALAVGSGEVAYFTSSREFLANLDSATGEIPIGPIGGPGTELHSGELALDPTTGNLFDDLASRIEEYAPFTSSPPTVLEAFPSTGLADSDGVAASGTGTVYATERTADEVEVFDEYPLAQVAVGAVSSLKPTSVTLQGSVNPEGAQVDSCEFEYGTTISYGQTAACEPAAGSLGEGDEPVLVARNVSGLQSGTTYHYRLVAGDAHGTSSGVDHTFTTPGPTIAEEHVSGVEAEAATLQATIDPNGEQTSYHFEYDTSPYTSTAAHGMSVPIPHASIDSGTSAVPVSVRVTGLEAGRVYYYRVVAESAPLGAPEAFYGLDDTFQTNPGSGGGRGSESCPNEQRRAEQPFGLTLPDCRAYELVSPQETGGQDATDDSLEAHINANARAAQSSANPAITYASKGSFGSPTGAATTNQFVSRRNAAGESWETQAVTPLWNPESTNPESSFESTVFEPELKAGIAATDASLPSSGAPTSLGGEFGLYVSDFATGSYRYVGSSLNPFGVSTDLSHVVFGQLGEVSEWVEGRTLPVSVTNEGTAIQATAGSAAPSFQSGFDDEHDAWHAVSSDGSRVYFTSPGALKEGGVHELYLRVNAEREKSPMKNANTPDEECEDAADACTIRLSTGEARYWGANGEGTKAFYTEGEDLYEYTLPIGHVSGQATALTHAAKVQGVVQISEDGSYVYFVAKGALKGEHGAALRNASGAEPIAEADNLYVSHEGGAPAFIATLAAGDESDWNTGGHGGPEINTAVVNPGGTHLAFLSTRELTGYDNDVSNGPSCGTDEQGNPLPALCTEIFEYDVATGSLECASCNPTGARPVGPSSFTTDLEGKRGSEQYRARNLLEDGTLFFDSSDALVPNASDGRRNVYEYEHGHVYAISNVAGGDESFFLDASPSGEDVFFGSADQLLKEDTGDNVIVWDARQDGGFPVPPAAPSCDNGDSCKPPPSQQPSAFAPTGSATFNGLGNFSPPKTAVTPKKKKTAAELRAEKLAKALKQCRKEKSKQKRAGCEKSARKKYAPIKPKKKAKKSADTNRGASR
jgi:DNA-binding beta-propeller fold protein YncE